MGRNEPRNQRRLREALPAPVPAYDRQEALRKRNMPRALLSTPCPEKGPRAGGDRVRDAKEHLPDARLKALISHRF